jgi:hypothetical protein
VICEMFAGHVNSMQLVAVCAEAFGAFRGASTPSLFVHHMGVVRCRMSHVSRSAPHRTSSPHAYQSRVML